MAESISEPVAEGLIELNPREEYKVLHYFETDAFEKRINELTAEGWSVKTVNAWSPVGTWRDLVIFCVMSRLVEDPDVPGEEQ